jgi:hypothetical protein
VFFVFLFCFVFLLCIWFVFVFVLFCFCFFVGVFFCCFWYFITLKICGYLQKQYAGDKEQWELVEKKAYNWIKKETKKLGVAENTNWQTLALQLVASVGL